MVTVSLRHLAPTLALLALLGACAPQVPPQPTPAPASPTPAPAGAAPAEATPAGAAPASPTPANALLPRPLYLLQAGQIFRLERDGTTRSQITYEVPFQPDAAAVTDFAVSPADGSLAYIVQREGPPVLVRSGPDGSEPVRLFEDPLVAPGEPLFTPDGQYVAVRLQGPIDEAERFVSGIYLIPAAGGTPRLLVADELQGDRDNAGFGHAPEAFAPDGSRLLTSRFGLSLELCDLAVVSVPDGTTIVIQAPAPTDGDRTMTCGTGVWSPDGATIYFAPLRIGAPGGTPAIWEADPITGESLPLPSPDAGTPLTLYASPFAVPDGSLRAFTAEVDELPPAFADEPPLLTSVMTRIDPATGARTALRPPLEETPGLVLWDAAGAGAVVQLFPAMGDAGLFWLPAGDAEPTLLLGATTDLFAAAWAEP
ncbi:MAG: hypothetical protein OHK0015_37480 [Chloroflexi bacterium OHK40]